MTNQQLADLLSQFADLLDIKGESGFRVSAYRRAVEALKHLGEPVQTLVDESRLTDIQGIGKGIAGNIEDILRIGHFPDLEDLQDEVPATLLTVLAIPGVGPKTVGRLYRELAITNLEDLEQALHQNQVSTLKGIGKKQEQRMLEGIAFLRQRTGRVSIGTSLPAARDLSQSLTQELETRVEIAGSVRRRCETVGNIDLLVESAELDTIESALSTRHGADSLTRPDERTIEGEIPGICSVRVVRSSSDRFGTDLIRLTGSHAHIEALPELAPDTSAQSGSEEAWYEANGLEWIPPELREGRGEVEAARENRLPSLVELSGIQGDLHLHSNWSDGRASIPELAARATELGYQFLSIADHSHSLGIANGLNEERLREQWREIEAANAEYPNVRLLRANEVEVRRDGTLDFPDEVLAELDLVVASLHSGRSMPREELTARLLTAIENPHVDIIGHPTGRIIEQRPPADYDWERVFEAAARTGTALEINANPARLDLPEDLARAAIEAGVLIAIDSDAHDLDGLNVMEYGIAIARRGWVPRDSVINTWDRDRLLEWLGG